MRQEVQDSEPDPDQSIVIGPLLIKENSGFKFLPVIGKHIADVFEDKAGPLLRERWAVRRPTDADPEPEMEGDGTRLGPRLRQLSRSEQAKL